MSLASRVDALALRIAQEIKAARNEIRTVASGGTGGTAAPTAGAAAYGTGTALGYTSAGTTKQALVSNGAGAPSFQTLDLTYMPESWVKKAVDAATTANITLSGAQTIDGVAVTTGSRVLVKNQTTASQNGLYDASTGAWARTPGANSASEVAGAMTSVDRGTTQGGMLYTNSFLATDTLGTTAMNWFPIIDGNAPDVFAGGRSVGRGVLSGGYAQIVANSANTNATATAVDIAGLAATVTVAANRRIKITLLMHVQSTIANDRAQLLIREGAATLGLVNGGQLVTVSTPYSQQFHTILTAPTAGVHTYKASFLRLSGTGTLTAYAANTAPASILVEDIGPST